MCYAGARTSRLLCHGRGENKFDRKNSGFRDIISLLYSVLTRCVPWALFTIFTVLKALAF